MGSDKKLDDNRHYNQSLFEDIFGNAFTNIQTTHTKKVIKSNGWSVSEGPVLYKWVDDNTLWIGVPGCDKNDIGAAKISDGYLNINWESVFCKASIAAPVPDGTQNIKIYVINGMMVVTFQTKPSDISITIK